MAQGWVAALAICAAAAAQTAVPSAAELWKQHMDLGRTLASGGHLSEAQDQFQLALRAAGPKDARGFAARMELGTLAAAMGQYVDAEQWDNQAVRSGEALYGKDSPELALPFSNLAALYRDQGDSGRAEEFGRRALGLIVDPATAPPATRAHVLGTLGGILYLSGKLPESETHLQESIRIARALPPPSEILAGDLNNLAGVYAGTGRLGEALDTYREADGLCQKTGGATDPCHFFIQAGMAAVHAASGQYTDAVSAIESGIRAAEAGGASNTLQLRDALSAEAVWLHKLKREAEAKRVRAKARQVAQAAALNSPDSRYTLDARQVAKSIQKAPQ